MTFDFGAQYENKRNLKSLAGKSVNFKINLSHNNTFKKNITDNEELYKFIMRKR